MTNKQLVQSNFEEKIKVFTNAVNGKFKGDDIFSVANTGMPTDTFNTLLIKSSNSKDSSKVKQELDCYMKQQYPFSVWVDVAHLDANWKQVLQAYNLKESESNMMIRENMFHVDEASTNQLTITNVENNNELLMYTDVFTSIFAGSTEQEALKSYFNKFSQSRVGPDVQMLIGCVDGKPVTTGLLIESKDSYGIYDVMTKEKFRGKGLGSEMFQFLLSQTKDKAKPVVLQASDDDAYIIISNVTIHNTSDENLTPSKHIPMHVSETDAKAGEDVIYDYFPEFDENLEPGESITGDLITHAGIFEPDEIDAFWLKFETITANETIWELPNTVKKKWHDFKLKTLIL